MCKNIIGTKIPKPTIRLNNGNAFYIIMTVMRTLKRLKVHKDVINSYREKATAGDYDDLLILTFDYANIE